MAALFAVALLLALSQVSAAQAQLNQSVSSTTFSKAGDVLTYTYTYNTGGYTVSALTLTAQIYNSFGQTLATFTNPPCTGLPAGQNSTITCKATYTITATDVTNGSALYAYVTKYEVTNGGNGTVFESGLQGSPAVLTTNYVAPTKTNTTTALSAAPASSSTSGQNVTFTATVTGSSPTGTVTFKDGSTTLGTGTLNGSGVATYSTSTLAVGSHSITASYGGDSANNSSTSSTLSYSVASAAPVAKPVSATVAYDSSANSITLDFSGGTAPTSVAVATQPSHGTAVASGTTITYTPTTGYAGADSFTYTGTNAGGTSAPATASITVSNPTLSITAGSSLSAKIGQAYSQTFTFSGGKAPYGSYVILGIPAGLQVTAFDTTSITVSGTPKASGTFHLTVQGTDSSTGSGPFTVSQNFTLIVAAPTITVSPSTLPGATQNVAYSQAISASGGTAPYTYSVPPGALPSGMSLSPSGVLSGTPTAYGTFKFTVTATDSSTGSGPYTGSQSYALSITAATPVFTTTSLPNATAGTAYSQTIQVTSGNAPYSFSLASGSTLPTGLSLSTGGVLSGTPTQVGSFNFTVQVKDNAGTTATQSFTSFTVSKGSPGISVSLSSGTVMQGVSVTMTAQLSGGASPTGSVTFKDGATTLATVPLSGLTASYTTAALAIGSHSITAVYSGDSLNTQATSAAQTLTVSSRPNPALDPTVRSMIFSQVSTGVHFAQTQIDNTSGRLGALHGEIASGSPAGGLPAAFATPATGGTASGGGTKTASIATPQPADVQGPEVTRNAQADSGQVLTTVSRAFESLEVQGGLPFHVWATGTLEFGKMQSNGAYDNRLRTSGITLGVDRRFGADSAAGLAFGYGYDHTTFGSDGSRSNAHAKSLSLYATWQVAPGTFIDATGGYGLLSYDERRWSSGGGVMLSGQRDGRSLFGSLGMTRVGGTGAFSTSSYGRVDVVRTSLDSYAETGSPLWALSYDKLSSTTVSGVAGISAQYAIPKSWGTLRPGAKIEYRHAFSGGFSQRLGYADLGTMDYAISGESQSQDALTLGLALRGTVQQNTDFDLEYQFSTDMGSVHNQRLRASIRFSF